MAEAAAAKPAAAGAKSGAPANAAPSKPAAKAKPKLDLSSSQKAAAVIVALGAEKASLLYKYMEPEDVEMLTLEVRRC